MKNVREFDSKNIKFIFTDIDDTLTHHGKLPAESYNALWKLHEKNFHVIPVTGRPAGWCEMIARFWPVSGIIGENGALYYRYSNNKMKRHYAVPGKKIIENRKKLNKISAEVLKKINGAQVASDQFCRIFDLAIDFCEDVKPLPQNKIQDIVNIFHKHKATAKISSIHVNGWFGKYDKLSMCKVFLKKEFQLDLEEINSRCAFVGDSPNDEPMFKFFQNSFAVANIKKFSNQLQHHPQFITDTEGGRGFVEFTEQMIGR